ncbi:MAG: prepilin-type N-terminal cleavage/methylation domain-containing protein [Nitrospirae bacterium]|nr:prepilin-type N-terminal cleavage/methylation domain-containing protein [Nitrospirota bacterium]
MINKRAEAGKQKAESGFTLIELIITMVVFVLAIASASQIFTGLLTQFKQQSRITETNIEGNVGLDILRQDLDHAGFGLPWNVTGIADSNGDGVINFSDNVPGYNEASAPTYNDAPNNPPRAFRSGDGAGPDVPGSDYLVIKSAAAAADDAAGKNTRLTSAAPYVRTWALYTDDLSSTDRVIVISPGSTDANSRSLVVTGGSFHTQYSAVSSYAPADNTDVRLVYGVSAANAANTLRAPFNRSDYYISTNAALPVPPRCVAGTGVLVKATLDHATGELTELPVLDCVADMQVIFLDNAAGPAPHNDLSTFNDTDGNGTIDADEIRDQLSEVRVYILAYEGQRDPNYVFNNFTAGACATCVRVGMASALGRDYDLSAITDYLNYRWKVYTLAVTTDNLR